MTNLSYPVNIDRTKNEYNILWMLNKNKILQWKDFTSAPLTIPESTLSNYLRKLISENLVFKNSESISENGNQKQKKIYKITPKGQERLKDIESFKKKGLVFPPNNIEFTDAKDKILWMLYNNTYCQWRDFLSDPININQSTLSNKLNQLKYKRFIKKGFVPELKHAVYKITIEGKKLYLELFSKYNLDRLSLYIEKLRNLGELNEVIKYFFQRFEIEDPNLILRFKGYRFNLDYLEHKVIIQNEQNYDLILLYLSINHPDNYPNYISYEDFSKKYPIKKIDLEYFINQIVKEKLYQVKVFQLRHSNNVVYYFHEGGKLENFLRVIVINYIKERFYDFCDMPDNKVQITGYIARGNMVKLICDKYGLIHEDLKNTLLKLLGKYINYLIWNEKI